GGGQSWRPGGSQSPSTSGSTGLPAGPETSGGAHRKSGRCGDIWWRVRPGRAEKSPGGAWPPDRGPDRPAGPRLIWSWFSPLAGMQEGLHRLTKGGAVPVGNKMVTRQYGKGGAGDGGVDEAGVGIADHIMVSGNHQ